jgi:methylmalonyl-CoA/ethylmalonyl-CoA epimerase
MTSAQDLKITRVGQIGIMVRNLDQAMEFYRDKLGIQHLFTAGGMAFFSLGEVRLMLGQAGPKDPSTTFLYYRVDDIDAAYQTLKKRGVTAIEAPELAHRAGNTELWLAILKDMDGNVLALMCEKAVTA